jgi:hypothetical protein
MIILVCGLSFTENTSDTQSHLYSGNSTLMGRAFHKQLPNTVDKDRLWKDRQLFIQSVLDYGLCSGYTPQNFSGYQLSVPSVHVCWVSKTDVQSVPQEGAKNYRNLFLYVRCDVKGTIAEKGEYPGCCFYLKVLVADWIISHLTTAVMWQNWMGRVRKLTAGWIVGMSAILRFIISCLLAWYLRIYRPKFAEVYFFLLFCMGVKLGLSYI